MPDGSDEPMRLAIELLAHAEHTGDVRVADEIIALLENGAAAHRFPDSDATYWSVLGMARHLRFEATGDAGSLRAAADAFRTVLDGVRRTDRRWPACASNLANVLVDVFETTGDEIALTEAVGLLSTAKVTAPPDDPNRPALLATLAKALNVLARIDDKPATRAEEIAVLREALATSAEDPILLSNLGNALAQYAARTSTTSALDEAVDAYCAAIANTPATHRDHGVFQSNLGNALTARFEVTGELGLLDQALAAHRAALAAAPASVADAARRRTNLAVTLVRRHEHVSDPAGLTEAVDLLCAASAATPPHHTGHAGSLVNLGSALSIRFSHSGDPADLADAIDTLRSAIRLLPPDHPALLSAESALSEAFTRRFEITGDPADLDEAVRLARSAVARTEESHVLLGLRLSNLAGALLRRFERVRHLASLDDAVLTARRAVEVTGADNPALPLRLAGLGSTLTARYVHLGDQRDLDDAVTVLRRAAANGERSDHAIRLSALGNALLRGHLATGDPALLTDAVQALRGAVSGSTDNDPNRTAYRSNLANTLRRSYELDGRDRDIAEAIALFRDAADRVGPDHPNHAAYQFNLGSAHRARFRRDGEPAAARDAAEAFLAAAWVSSAPAFVRATAAFNAGRVAADGGHASLARDGFAAAVALLDRLAWPGLPRADQEEILRRFSGLATDAAAWAVTCGEPDRAVELVDRGRGVLLGQAIDARSPYDRLHEAAPDLADALRRLRVELDRFDTPVVGADDLVAETASRAAAERRMALAAEHDRVVGEITACGLSALLAPPSAATLRQAAADGPVVVLNISRYRCDALVVTSSEVLPLPLRVTADEVARRTVAFVNAVDSPDDDDADDVLDWLFERIAEPVLQRLGLTGAVNPDAAPRLWWCPTGLLTFLPLHAAAPRMAHESRPAVLDRVASSYAPTLRALLHARRQRRLRPSAGPPRSLVVAVSQAPHQVALPAVKRETAAVRQALPGTRLLLDGEATADAVLEAIPTLDWLHLACHGRQDPTAPSDGHLRMHDGPLTVRRLAQRHGTSGELAVLTACETIRGGPELSDEVITVAAAIQLAGFRHVVGTLWASKDSISARFVDVFYDDLATSGGHADDSARALHRALVSLRRRYSSPKAWAPFAHLGP